MEKKQQNTKKKPFWKNLLITKKTIEKDPNDNDVEWVTLDLYNPYKDIGNSKYKKKVFKTYFQNAFSLKISNQLRNLLLSKSFLTFLF